MKKLIALFVLVLFTQSAFSEQFIVAGTIRNTLGYFEVISDTAHSPVNIIAVTTKDDRINFSYPLSTKIHTVMITMDETYTKNGFYCGTSAGNSYSAIFCYKNGVLQNPKTDMVGAASNIWIHGVFSD